MDQVEDKVAIPSLIDYLPAVYRREYESRGDEPGNPLKAILFILDDLFSVLEKKIDTVAALFDPWQTPGKGFLDWLATWVALEPEEGWSEEKKRELVKDAAVFYRDRGTPRGLKSLIRRFFDMDVEIEEWCWPSGLEIGIYSSIGLNTVLYERQDPGRCFRVTWRPQSPEIAAKFTRKIRRWLDLERPAHTHCYFNVEFPKADVAPLQPMVIGIFSLIGKCYIGEK